MKIEEDIYSNHLQISELDDSLLDFFSSTSNPTPLQQELLEEDLWSFGWCWPQVAAAFSTVDRLYAAIQDLRDEIRQHKEKWRPSSADYSKFHIEPNVDRGISGSYFLVDEQGIKRYIIKPIDEDAGCINSPGYPTPFYTSPFREYMPLYRSAMRETLAFLIAQSIPLDSIVPETVLGIIRSDQFHDFSDGIAMDELKRYIDLCGAPDQEKLCSIQEFVPHAKTLFEALQDLQMAGLSDDEIADRFDQDQFEEANLLLWITFDTDGHSGNFLVYPKGTDEIGNEKLGLKKIDSGLAFPEKNKYLRNSLSLLPNAKRELSEHAKEKIARLNIDELTRRFETMELEGSISAMKERVAVLQNLAQRPGITIQEVNTEMSKIGKRE